MKVAPPADHKAGPARAGTTRAEPGDAAELPPAKRSRPLSRIMSWVGWTCIAAGVVLLGYVVYQLWGTRWHTIQAQRDLTETFNAQAARLREQRDLRKRLEEAERYRIAAEKTGGPIARIRIPKIGVDSVVVAGVDREDLRNGPGLMPGTAFPGTPGNTFIAGHRTTYGAEFNRIDELTPGDVIIVTTPVGKRRYKVRSSQIVTPKMYEVALPTEDNRLTLSTCTPKFSAKERLIVVADLVGKPYPRPAGPSSRALSPPSVLPGGEGWFG
jgi:sortase A